METEDYSFVNDPLFKKEEEGANEEEKINKEDEESYLEEKDEEDDPLSINANKNECKIQKEECSK